MTAREFARLTNAKKVGKNRWLAKCPSHPDRHPSLSITTGKRVPVLLICQSQHCHWKDILKALDLPPSALFDGKPTPEVRRRLSLSEQKESLERQLGLVIMLGCLSSKAKVMYWAAAERRIRSELFWIRWTLEPEKIEEEICLRLNNMRSTPSKRSTDATSPTKYPKSSQKTTLDFGW